MHANADAKSLRITAKGRVVSPTFCVSSQHPSFRFFAKRTSGSWGVLNVSLRWSVDGGATNETTVGSVATGTSWTPTQSFGLSQTLGIWNSSQTASVQIILDPEDYGGNWAVDGMTNAPVVRSRSSGAGDQARDVLMHTMRAKQPGLQDHSSRVAELAVAVARWLA